VAAEEHELVELASLGQRAEDNGVACTRLGGDALGSIEPHVRGLAGLHVPSAAITDYRAVAMRLAAKIVEGGSELRVESCVQDLRCSAHTWRIQTPGSLVEAAVVLNCAGLHADRIAEQCGVHTGLRIVPFRGEYYRVVPSATGLCRGLIYPVPDRRFPFLGVHLTARVDGGLECGPNAVFALAREGYDWKTIAARDLWEAATYPGFVRLAARHWRTGAAEVWRSLHKASFARSLQRLVPEITPALLRRGPAGVRAQALAPDGSLVDDFVVLEQEGAIHVCNAPSPGATASLAIGENLCQRAHQVLETKS